MKDSKKIFVCIKKKGYIIHATADQQIEIIIKIITKLTFLL